MSNPNKLWTLKEMYETNGTKPKCAGCIFTDVVENDRQFGDCKLYPPTADPTTGASMYPEIEMDGYCSHGLWLGND